MTTDERFAPALDALLSNDAGRLAAVVRDDPDLVTLRWNGNTLLEWVTQPPHGIEPEVVAVLIDAGSELDRALNLAACFDQASLCEQLLTAGADPTVRADADITPLESAAMHGSSEAADVLVAHGVHRPGLWLAAASGQLDIVRSMVSAHGAIVDPTGIGAYRPNFADVGRTPGASPTDDPAEILGEALVFAGANGRIAVVDYLLAAGVDIDSRPYRSTTALHLAVQFAKSAMVMHLLAAGAAVDITDDEYNGTALGWAVACDDGSDPAVAIRNALEG